MYYPPLCHLLPRLPATGRADAQKEELANLRNQNMTFTNDVRLNNVRLGADGVAAEKMGLLQFASTLHATHNVTQPKKEGDEGDPAVAPAVAPFDAMAALRAMSAQTAGSFQGAQGGAGGAPLLGYEGAAGEEKYAKEQRKKRREKKRKRKAKRVERKEKMAKKRLGNGSSRRRECRTEKRRPWSRMRTPRKSPTRTLLRLEQR